jgi:hypothetical protein
LSVVQKLAKDELTYWHLHSRYEKQSRSTSSLARPHSVGRSIGGYQ